MPAAPIGSTRPTSPFEYAPAPESAAAARLREHYGVFVDGRFRAGRGEAVKTLNPATEEPLAEVAEANEADVADAVEAARRAYDRVWSKTSGRDRAKYLFRIARAIQERSRELAVLETLDNGKPIKESCDVDVPTAAAHFHAFEPVDAPTRPGGSVLSGRDLRAGGTWLGVNRAGRVAFRYVTPTPPRRRPRSHARRSTNITEEARAYASTRGALTSAFLLPARPGEGLHAHVARVLAEGTVYAGFNLLLLAPRPRAEPGALTYEFAY